jgi:SAM-dependent methyltransferase
VSDAIQADVPVDSEAYAQGSRRRFRKTLSNVDALAAPVLDLGPPNALARVAARQFGVEIAHTDEHDLDRERLSEFRPGPWATITAFEILEHLMNPLFVLDGCREVLQPDGVLYLSVPRRHPWEEFFGKSPEHFHEFTHDELRWLLHKANFRIELWVELNTTELHLGLRPLLRRLFHNLFFVKCRPA